MSDIDDRIDEIINKPKSASSESGSVTEVSVDDLIKADMHASRKAAVTSRPKRMGLRMGRFTSPEQY